MTLALESIAYPKRAYVRASSMPVGNVTGGSPLNTGKLTYTVDELGDVRGRRTDRVVILENLGNALLFCMFFDRTNARVLRRIHFNNDAWNVGTAYLTGAFVSSDGKLWECIVGGTAAVAPTGTTDFVDGALTWRQRFGPLGEGGAVAAVQTGTIYRVSAWDIDARAWVAEYYPESELDAAIPYQSTDVSRSWLDLPDDDRRHADPTTVLPRVTVRHVDMDSPPADVGDLARVHELTGGI